MNSIKLFLRTDQKNKDGSHTVSIRFLDSVKNLCVRKRSYIFAKNLKNNKNL